MQKVVLMLVMGLVVYGAISAVLILTDRPQPLASGGSALRFDPLTAEAYVGLPDLRSFTARDGTTLYTRFYESAQPSSRVLILLHGSAWHGMQFHPLAKALSAEGATHVVVPDLRGHGFHPATRGDVAYVGQLEDDLAELIAQVRRDLPGATVIVGGHSSGGGLAIRFAGGAHGRDADGYLLLAPFLKYNAPTMRPNAGGWAIANTRRIVGLSMLNTLGIRWFNGLPVIQFAMPQSVLDGPLGATATPTYSYRLNVSFAPRSRYQRDLAAMQQPFLLVAGSADEAFLAEQYEPTISAHTDAGRYVLLPAIGHIDLLTTPQLTQEVALWLNGTFGQ